MRGRKGKTLEQHERDGTLNITRHRDLLDAAKLDGTPEKPAHLTGDAEWMWDFVTAELAEKCGLKRLDTMALTACCEQWGLYRAVMEKLRQYPTDRDARVAMVQFHDRFMADAAKLGLNPTDRQRIKTEGTKKDNGKARFFAG